jgi:hypothetical protein
MTDRATQTLDALDVLIGEWGMVPSFAANEADAPRARTTFEWLPEKRFLIQRWEVDHPDAPDGIAIIGLDLDTGKLLQHYFDSRGVARVYEMTFLAKIWKLERRAAAPDFSQRFTGTIDADGDTIFGRWEHSSDGSIWHDDFGLTYTRVR